MRNRMKRACQIAAVCMFAAAPVSAETPTEALMQSFGQMLLDSGAARVTQQGEDVVLTLDYAPVIHRYRGDIDFKMTPLVLTLHPEGDGKWQVSADQPVSFSVAIENVLNIEVDAARLRYAGSFDEKSPLIFTIHGGLSDIHVSETLTSPDGQRIAVEATIENETLDIALQPSSPGYAFTAKVTASNLVETVSTPEMPGGPVKVSIGELTQILDITNIRGDELAQLMDAAQNVPAASADDLLSGNARDVTLAIFPVFDLLRLQLDVNDVTVETPVGPVGLAHLGLDADMTGIVEDGAVHARVDLSGPSYPAGLLPDWMTEVMPQDVTFDMVMKGFRFRPFFIKVLEDGPSGKMAAYTTADDAALEDILLPGGGAQIELSPVGLSSPLYTLTSDTDMAVNINNDNGTLKSKISLTGLDEIMSVMNSAPPDVKGEVLPLLGFMQALARFEGETAVWDIDFSTAPDRLTVNGTPLTP